ncbi:MAG: DUF3047 domain-containing protein [Gammaproteobacteria bacterium]|jgi:hypothetical protein|nr:DUF3047 domain-containing protein [Gammaproteobacteria bacterium]MBU0771822.1 DUF3047 domain-containing protein [Gammaproteobacteria bacterium]MBU0855578.1 DUF3047 domain-containing protein [Gammaproteobacteria bacterium]MBU1846140.1 DUF3047 domain-containing protein [Gammaproteobacteria bacterium]
MKTLACAALAVCLCAGPAIATAETTHEQFEQQVRNTLAPVIGKSVTGLKVLHVSADLGPWLDTGMQVKPGEPVTVVLSGKAWLSRHYDISLEAPLQLWRRIGTDGPITRNVRNTDTFEPSHAGTLQLKNLPTRWLDASGAYAGTPGAASADAGGGVSVALIRWAPGSNVASELAALAGEAAAPTWVAAEVTRPKTLVAPPDGWRYLWELGPAEIFSARSSDGSDGGPASRIDAHTRNDVAILQHDVSVPLEAGTTLQWSWKVNQLPARSAEDTAIGHDYLSIAVEFDNGQDLTYLWSRQLPQGHHFKCPLEGWHDRETHVVARTGPAELGKWLAESRDIMADYAKTIGGPAPARITRVWLIANSVFGRGEGHAQFGDIRLGKEGERIQVW